MQGIPVALPNGKTVRVQMPDLPDPERDGEYGVLFLDEITTADEMQVQPALGLALPTASRIFNSILSLSQVLGQGNNFPASSVSSLIT